MKVFIQAILVLILSSCSVFQKKSQPQKVPIDQILVQKDSVKIKQVLKKPEIKKLLTKSILKDSMTFLFMGDIMGHGPQIKSAYVDSTKAYNYDKVFEKMSPLFNNYDHAIANLEVTLAGKPYMGYPRFSSPEALAISSQKSGIDVLVTSNNHIYDRGEKGLVRTLDVLDSLDIKHTGSFRDSVERINKNLMLFESKSLRIGMLNYTFWTNVQIDTPITIVNVIDTILMAKDIEIAKSKRLDKLIMMLHWGPEYKINPSRKQQKTAKFLFRKGVDIIIGAHPHVIQPMIYYPADSKGKEELIAYSLGNFVSNQRTEKRDGGALISFKVIKEGNKVELKDINYHLSWVHKYRIGKKWNYEILPVKSYEKSAFKGLNKAAKEKMGLFIKDSRVFLNAKNKDVSEHKE